MVARDLNVTIQENSQSSNIAFAERHSTVRVNLRLHYSKSNPKFIVVEMPDSDCVDGSSSSNNFPYHLSITRSGTLPELTLTPVSAIFPIPFGSDDGK
jgi:hypothetical protein